MTSFGRICRLAHNPETSIRRGFGVLLSLLLLVSCVQKPTGPSDAEIAAQLGSGAPLLPLYRALWSLEARKSTAPVVILQIGDSHTANDAFSGRLRELFQTRFGDAGRGVLPPGIPYRYYRPARVSVTAQGWTVESSFRSSASGPFGITGLRQHASGPAVMTLSADAGDINRFSIEVLRQPGGGTVDINLDTGEHTTNSTNGADQTVWVSVSGTPNTRTATVGARGDGPVDVLAWTIIRNSPGVIYANLGTIGATVDLIDRWDPSIVRQDLAQLSPTMIVLAFGTNEGFHDSVDPSSYASAFAAKLRELHAAAPGAALLVLGPPDGERHRRKGVMETDACGDPNWVQPPRLAQIREAQRVAAEREGAYFWDWSAAMGGTCSMLRWATTEPPLGAPDHVHLFAPGYQATAEELFRTIMDGYARYRALRATS